MSQNTTRQITREDLSTEIRYRVDDLWVVSIINEKRHEYRLYTTIHARKVIWHPAHIECDSMEDAEAKAKEVVDAYILMSEIMI